MLMTRWAAPVAHKSLRAPGELSLFHCCSTRGADLHSYIYGTRAVADVSSAACRLAVLVPALASPATACSVVNWSPQECLQGQQQAQGRLIANGGAAASDSDDDDE